jgi:hypothetical protein
MGDMEDLKTVVLTACGIDPVWLCGVPDRGWEGGLLPPYLSDVTLAYDKGQPITGGDFPPGWRRIPVSVSGLHHGKVLLLRYSSFLRVVICSSNLTAQWDYTREIIWAQDFPIKYILRNGARPPPPGSTDFGRSLLRYIEALDSRDSRVVVAAWQRATAGVDLSTAAARVVVSIAGTHRGDARDSTGFCRLGQVGRAAAVPLPRARASPVNTLRCREQALTGTTWPAAAKRAPLLCYASSMGNLKPDWLWNFHQSATADGKHPALGRGEALGGGADEPVLGAFPNMRFIWPTLEDVIVSNQEHLGGVNLNPNFWKDQEFPRHLFYEVSPPEATLVPRVVHGIAVDLGSADQAKSPLRSGVAGSARTGPRPPAPASRQVHRPRHTAGLSAGRGAARRLDVSGQSQHEQGRGRYERRSTLREVLGVPECAHVVQWGDGGQQALKITNLEIGVVLTTTDPSVRDDWLARLPLKLPGIDPSVRRFGPGDLCGLRLSSQLGHSPGVLSSTDMNPFTYLTSIFSKEMDKYAELRLKWWRANRAMDPPNWPAEVSRRDQWSFPGFMTDLPTTRCALEAVG